MIVDGVAEEGYGKGIRISFSSWILLEKFGCLR